MLAEAIKLQTKQDLIGSELRNHGRIVGVTAHNGSKDLPWSALIASKERVYLLPATEIKKADLEPGEPTPYAFVRSHRTSAGVWVEMYIESAFLGAEHFDGIANESQMVAV